MPKGIPLSGINKGWFKKGNKVNAGRRQTGSNNPCWKGGRIYEKEGYILSYAPDHPFCVDGKYIREHRLIMEKHLGRYLRPEEIVHHKNGIRDDNHIENLTLFLDHREHSKFHKKEKGGD